MNPNPFDDFIETLDLPDEPMNADEIAAWLYAPDHLTSGAIQQLHSEVQRYVLVDEPIRRTWDRPYDALGRVYHGCRKQLPQWTQWLMEDFFAAVLRAVIVLEKARMQS